ncbi:MAG TPA: c-type cytochrome [Gaiellaceae bacterium]|nr:c-type cytochrome [Gaiellaceae bacterium]
MRRGLGAVCLLAAVLAVTGCGTEGTVEATADPAQGKTIFQETCGGCHTLREAGTQGSNPEQNPASGPNLDDAFAAAREEGFDESTIRETVRHQIDYPIPPMPEDLLDDTDADAVAMYVAMVAANPDASVGGGAGGGGDDPKSLFTTNCGSCHVLEAAGTQGQVGPNLDETQPTFERSLTQITNGGGGMPAFGDRLTDEQIRALARYVADSTRR